MAVESSRNGFTNLIDVGVPNQKKGLDGIGIVYDISNERYSKMLIQKIEDAQADRYMGILGAGDQNLLIVGALQQKRSLQSVELVDINFNQIKVASESILDYNYMGYRDLPYFEKLREHRIELRRCSITLKHNTIESELSSAMESGVYFIYLSNAFPISVPFGTRNVVIGGFYGKNGFNDTDNVLATISRNKSILPGSTVMIASLPSIKDSYSSVVMLRKDNEAGNSEYKYDIAYVEYHEWSLLRKQ